MTTYEPVLVQEPGDLPVSVDECKLHLRIDSDDEDELIEMYLTAGVSHLDGANGWLGRSIVSQAWSQQFDAFAHDMLLNFSPVSSITSVVYLDADGIEQTVNDDQYQLINGGSSPTVRFVNDFVLPTTQTDLPVVTITFVSGYSDDTDEIPAAIKVAILLMVGDMYQSREAKVENTMMENNTVRRLLDPYRARWMA
jgi:uncharacterized phiE125 gp8 family phage protein